MRRGMITLMCVAGLMLFAGPASALDLEWTLLMDGSVAGATPVQQGSNWVVAPGAGGTNGCNFSTAKNCASGGVPGVGSYSFTAIEYNAAPGDPSTWYSCLDLSGSQYSGAPCVCAEPAGQPCTSDAQCDSGGSCAGAGDCCPGPLWTCEECTEVPGPDSFSFFGVDGSLGPAPNMDTCQDAGANDFEITRYHVATSESISGSGGACIKLVPTGGPYLGGPCGVGPITFGSLDVDVYVGGCALKGTTINNIQYTGEIYDVTNGSPSGTCGYTGDQIHTMLGQVPAGGLYLMVMCGTTVVPNDSQTACLRNADVDFVVVAYTEQNASDCSGSCP